MLKFWQIDVKSLKNKILFYGSKDKRLHSSHFCIGLICQTISVTNKKKTCCNKDSQFISEVCIFCQIEQCASQHHPRNENKKQLVKHETSRTLCHNELSSSTLNLEDAIN